MACSSPTVPGDPPGPSVPRPRRGVARIALLAGLCWGAATPGMPSARAQAGTDQMELEFVIEDDTARRLSRPVIALHAADTDPIVLVDDGTGIDEQPADGVWSGGALCRRRPRLSFTLEDRATGESLGTYSVFLPARGEARVVGRTTEGEPPLLLESEDGVSESADGSIPGSGQGQPTAPVQGGERFAWLLWVTILLGVLALGYVRGVVRRLYLRDFLPTWQKLDRWLDRELGDDGPPAGSGGGGPSAEPCKESRPPPP